VRNSHSNSQELVLYHYLTKRKCKNSFTLLKKK